MLVASHSRIGPHNRPRNPTRWCCIYPVDAWQRRRRSLVCRCVSIGRSGKARAPARLAHAPQPPQQPQPPSPNPVAKTTGFFYAHHNHKIPHNHKPSYKFWLIVVDGYIYSGGVVEDNNGGQPSRQPAFKTTTTTTKSPTTTSLHTSSG